MEVSVLLVLLRLFRIHEQNSIFKDTTIGLMIPKQTKYNMHYGEVRGDILRLPHGTNTGCSVVK